MELIELIMIVAVAVPCMGEGHWNYDGPMDQDWTKLYPECGGKHQSPINIDVSKVVQNKSLDIIYNGYYTSLRHTYLENNGHTVLLGVEDEHRPLISGSALGNKIYKFKQMHFHWANDNTAGSEHRINNHRYNLELHLVHYNIKYKTEEEVLKNQDGIVVLSVLFKVAQHNKYLTPLLKFADKIRYYKDRVTIFVPIILRNFLPAKPKPFFVYSGSLTTPPCSEAVTWVIYKQINHLSNSQEAIFRRERGNNANGRNGEATLIKNNFRGLHPLNGRVVMASGP